MQHLVYSYRNGTGLAVAMYGPAHIIHTLPSGQQVMMDIITDYPFSDSILVHVMNDDSLYISLRIPSWANGASVIINNNSPITVTPGMYVCIHSPHTQSVCVY